MTPFEVTAELATGRVVLPDPWSLMLDGLLASVVLRERLGDRFGMGGPLVELEPDNLPLATETHGGVWWFQATSTLAFDDPVVVTENLIGRQDTYAARLYCSQLPKSIQTQGGRYRNVMKPVPVTLVGSLVWRGVGDPGRVEDLLGGVTHVGARRGSGFGRVASWSVAECDGWPEMYRDGLPGPNRPLPVGYAAARGFATVPVPSPIRAPYHKTKERRAVEVAARW